MSDEEEKLKIEWDVLYYVNEHSNDFAQKSKSVILLFEEAQNYALSQKRIRQAEERYNKLNDILDE